MKNEENKNYKYQIRNLNCPNCALKIENKISKLQDVSDISIDLVHHQMLVSSSSENKSLLKRINKIANHIEPGIMISDSLDHDETVNMIEILRIVIGFIIFLLAYLNVFSTSLTIVLFISAYALVGYEVIYKAFRNISKGYFFDENFLMTIATLAAVYVKSYPEAVAVMLFYEVGEFFQEMAVNRSRKSIKQLIDIQPKYAHLKQGDEWIRVEPSKVKVNDQIIVKPGEKIPLDGIVIQGQSTVDTSQLTGESIPRNIETDDEVLAGFINFNGLLTISVTKRYEDTAVNKILELVQNAQSKKAKVEKFITKFAKVYTPIVISLAIMIVTIPMLFIENYKFNDYLYRGAIFLVVSCPCALVVSIPLSIFGGIGASSRQGILIKGGNYLDVIRKTGLVVFDKTGTLTKGNFVVTKVVPINIKRQQLIEKTIIAESLSNHAIGKAVVEYQSIDVNQSKIKSFEEIFGHGIKAQIEDEFILAGNAKLMRRENIMFNETLEIGTIVYVAINNKYVGYFVIEDEIKEEAVNTITQLKRTGIHTVMLTGDNQKVADEVGKRLTINKVYADLLPEDKLKILKQLKINQSKTTMFVGDGVNDTPVMMAADVSVAMGGLGSDAAIETSDVVIMNDNIKKIIIAKEIAEMTHHKVWQNISLALGVKFIVLSLSAFGIATMWGAVFADVGVSLLAVINSILILRYKNKQNDF